MSEQDADLIRRLDGMHVGLLSPEELAALERCVQAGIARRTYEGASGLLGLARVRIVHNGTVGQ